MNSQAFPPKPEVPGTDAEASANGASRDIRGLGIPTHDALADTSSQQPLREAVGCAMRRYFEHLDGGDVTGLHAMVMAEVEAPLLIAVLDHTQGNQTRAAEILGLNRGTLRKKLKQYDLL